MFARLRFGLQSSPVLPVVTRCCDLDRKTNAKTASMAAPSCKAWKRVYCLIIFSSRTILCFRIIMERLSLHLPLLRLAMTSRPLCWGFIIPKYNRWWDKRCWINVQFKQTTELTDTATVWYPHWMCHHSGCISNSCSTSLSLSLSASVHMH